MAPRRRYRLDRVAVEPGERRASTWTFGGKPVSGTEQAYSVLDGNFRSRNEWAFVVRLPKERDGRIEVRPRVTPNVKVWAELPDRSITFSRATKGDARGKWYCQVALADPTGARSRDIVRGDERGALPAWFDALRSRMRVKQNVKNTKGTDGEALVVLVSAGDHAAMIRLFFATKVWVLKERITLTS
ncbi:MAG TPA: hypothetical protein VGQ24_02145 [Gemmatimonadales bacterium]|jgi:hypothetical protein|nr:hypothetical protein [Gemmatimonadales bacterium]